MTDGSPRRGWSDHEVESVVGNLLRAGVLLAAAVVALGGVLYLVRYGAARPQQGVFHGEPADLRSVGGIVLDALRLSRRGIIQLGVLLLIATPVARVVFSIVAFLQQRDGKYVVVTLIVLAGLLYSLIRP
jgi:uncharacterized membrane protein